MNAHTKPARVRRAIARGDRAALAAMGRRGGQVAALLRPARMPANARKRDEQAAVDDYFREKAALDDWHKRIVPANLHIAPVN